MGAILEVTGASFQEDVLEQSFQTPVLVDFFAQWCGPCQLLKPLLEKLAQEYDFTLAKVDIDQNPELARIYQVEGVPDVKVAIQGQIYNGFVGMLTEPQLREFLGQLNLTSAFDRAISDLEAAKATGDQASIRQHYAALLSQYPDRPALALEAAKFYLSEGDFAAAEDALNRIDPLVRPYGDQAAAIRSLMGFHEVGQTVTPDTEAAQLYLAGAKAAIAADYEAALEFFLQLVKCDRTYQEDAGRKALLTLFTFLGDEHPLTQTYRKRLMQALY